MKLKEGVDPANFFFEASCWLKAFRERQCWSIILLYSFVRPLQTSRSIKSFMNIPHPIFPLLKTRKMHR